MSSINSMVVSALNGLGVPVTFQIYDGKEPTYITFFEYNQFGSFNADDDEQLTAHFIQVDVWSDGDYSDLVDQVKEAMKQIGFMRTSEVDVYQNDIGYFHKALRFRLN